MKKYISLLALIVLILSAIYCGGKKQESSKKESKSESAQMTSKADSLKAEAGSPAAKPDELVAHNPNAPAPPPQPWDTLPRGPEFKPDDLVPGTPEYAAYWFAEYFTSGDSSNALALAADNMKPIVRAILQQPQKMDDLKRNRMAGYTILSASLLDPAHAGNICTVCLKATLFNETREECTYVFKKINGKWLMIDW